MKVSLKTSIVVFYSTIWRSIVVGLVPALFCPVIIILLANTFVSGGGLGALLLSIRIIEYVSLLSVHVWALRHSLEVNFQKIADDVKENKNRSPMPNSAH